MAKTKKTNFGAQSQTYTNQEESRLIKTWENSKLIGNSTWKGISQKNLLLRQEGLWPKRLKARVLEIYSSRANLWNWKIKNKTHQSLRSIWIKFKILHTDLQSETKKYQITSPAIKPLMSPHNSSWPLIHK